MDISSPDPSYSVILDNVSVAYRVPRENFSTFKEYAIRLIQGRVKYTQFWALNQVSFKVKRGEIFGLIGRNGAGKSTLLKLVARVLRPTTGKVLVAGRVAPLLEVGAGFHADLSGRENVELNGALLGYSQNQIKTHFSNIVEFSELESFIDAPLRTYSSGMVARLGFAVATEFRPDVLIVDEILGVGDESFQEKCFKRILNFAILGTTILLVSHNSSLVERICSRAVLLDSGKVCDIGDSHTVVKEYREKIAA